MVLYGVAEHLVVNLVVPSPAADPNSGMEGPWSTELLEVMDNLACHMPATAKDTAIIDLTSTPDSHTSMPNIPTQQPTEQDSGGPQNTTLEVDGSRCSATTGTEHFLGTGLNPLPIPLTPVRL